MSFGSFFAWREGITMKIIDNNERLYKVKKTDCLFFLHGIFLLYSCSSFLGKSAALQPWGTLLFWELYGGMIALLMVYAIGWQKILRTVPLSIAYMHRVVTLFWGLVMGRCFFGEPLTIGKTVGVAIVMVGLILFNSEWRSNDV